MADLPAPLVGSEVNLDGMPAFMLDTQRLLGSELLAKASDAGFRAAVLLWCKAWTQKPHGSLPNDDAILRNFAGCTDARRWHRVRDEALHRFILCSDGRLYHPVLCEDVLRAWGARQKNTKRTEAATAARKRTVTTNVTSPTLPNVTSTSRTPLRSPNPVSVSKNPTPPSSDSVPARGGGVVPGFALIGDIIEHWPKPGPDSKAHNHWTHIIGEGADPTTVHAAALAYLESVKGTEVRFVPQLHRWLEGGTWRRPVVPKGATVGAVAPEDRRRVIVSQVVRFGTPWHEAQYGEPPTEAEVLTIRAELADHLRDFAAHRVRWDEARWGRRPTVAELDQVRTDA